MKITKTISDGITTQTIEADSPEELLRIEFKLKNFEVVIKGDDVVAQPKAVKSQSYGRQVKS